MNAEVKRMKEEGRKQATPSREAYPLGRHSGASRGFIADGTRNPASLSLSDRQNSKSSNGPWPIPPTWCWRALGDLAEVKLGKMLDRAKHTSGHRLPYLRNVNVRWGTIETNDLLEMNFEESQLDRFGLEANDVLVCEGGEPGRASVWNGNMPNMKFQKALHRVRFKASYEPRLLVYFLELLRKSGRLERRFTGSTIKHLTREAFIQLPVPFPPPSEQRQIVAEIEKQFTRLDAGIAALRRVQANLKRYRAAVLKAACEGRLVPTQAELAKTDGRSFETGEQLLARILANRRKNWHGRGKYKEPAAPDTTNLPPPSEGWAWARAEQLCEFITKGTTPASTKMFSGQGDIPFLKVYNLTFTGALSLEYKPVFVSRSTHDRELGRSEVRAGDILINIVGPPLGQVSVVPPAVKEANINQAIARFRVVLPECRAQLALCLMTRDVMAWAVRRAKTTAGQSNLTLEVCRELPIPLPPRNEQVRIVAEVERRLSVIQQLEAAVTANLQRAARLRQSVLQKAFIATT